jgi:hypothetical protein
VCACLLIYGKGSTHITPGHSKSFCYGVNTIAKRQI